MTSDYRKAQNLQEIYQQQFVVKVLCRFGLYQKELRNITKEIQSKLPVSWARLEMGTYQNKYIPLQLRRLKTHTNPRL